MQAFWVSCWGECYTWAAPLALVERKEMLRLVMCLLNVVFWLGLGLGLGLAPGMAVAAAATSDARGCVGQGRQMLAQVQHHWQARSASVLQATYRVARALRRYPDLRVKIVVHSDTRGGHIHNKKRTTKLAKQMLALLHKKHKIKKARIQALGQGDACPLTSNKHWRGRRTNRRITWWSQPRPNTKTWPLPTQKEPPLFRWSRKRNKVFRVYFRSGEATLTRRQHKALKRWISAIRRYTAGGCDIATFRIKGFAHSQEASIYGSPHQLGRRRAATIKHILRQTLGKGRASYQLFAARPPRRKAPTTNTTQQAQRRTDIRLFLH